MRREFNQNPTATSKKLEEEPEGTIWKEERLAEGGRVAERICQAQSTSQRSRKS